MRAPADAGRAPFRRRAGLPLTAGLVAVALVTGYFLLPLQELGPHRPVLSWTLFVLALAVVAAGILRQIQEVVTDKPGTRPGLGIPVLMVLSVLVFASCYYALSHQPGELTGLRTRIDALYFTLVTLATVGYGDITPHGQAARVVTILQIVYTFVFLTAAATTLSRRAHGFMNARSSHHHRDQ
ncbi:potassium channel family protein [Streptomyces sp. PD-S100-1]|uniref:potassium channel family protein n=1 Tax=Streptomyces sp. PD-S100-1 TaxID=3394351 RepID=UPI0039BD4770